jgi:hypothetical protein
MQLLSKTNAAHEIKAGKWLSQKEDSDRRQGWIDLWAVIGKEAGKFSQLVREPQLRHRDWAYICGFSVLATFKRK